MFLELYLSLVLMTIDITALADVAGQMGVILVMQAVIMALFADLGAGATWGLETVEAFAPSISTS